MKNKYIKIILSLLVVFSILLAGISSFAADDIITKDDIKELEAQLEAIKKRQEDTEKALADIEKDENYVQSSIAYSQQLVKGYSDYVLLLTRIIEEYDAAIKQTNAKIDELSLKYDEIYAIYLTRLRMAREDNTYSVLELVFASESVTELISAFERASDIIDYDKRVIKKLEIQKQTLAGELESYEKFKQGQQEQIDGYELLKVSVKERVDELNAQLTELQDKKDEVESLIGIDELLEKEADKALEDMIAAYEKQQATSASYAVGEKMRWPLKSKWNYISSPFGYRIHPIFGTPEGHKGMDIPASKGEPIYAVLSGKVIKSVYSSSYGYYIIIDHGVYGNTGKRLYSLYAHSSKLLVEEGDMVKQGDVIAKVGSTGWSTGPHLHFEVRYNNIPTDPLGYVEVPK